MDAATGFDGPRMSASTPLADQGLRAKRERPSLSDRQRDGNRLGRGPRHPPFDALPDQVVANCRRGWQLEQRRVPRLDLNLVKEPAEELGGQLGIECEPAPRKHMGNLGRVVATRCSDGDEPAGFQDAPCLGKRQGGIEQVVENVEQGDRAERLIGERKCGRVRPVVRLGRTRQHLRRGIDAHPRARGKVPGQFALAAADVEHRRQALEPPRDPLVHVGGERQVALDRIRVPENVRTLDDAHVQALEDSIKLQGILVPAVVRDDGDNGSSSSPAFIGSRPPSRSAWLRCRSSCATRRPRTPAARSRTSPHANIGMR